MAFARQIGTNLLEKNISESFVCASAHLIVECQFVFAPCAISIWHVKRRRLTAKLFTGIQYKFTVFVPEIYEKWSTNCNRFPRCGYSLRFISIKHFKQLHSASMDLCVLRSVHVFIWFLIVLNGFLAVGCLIG